MGETLSLSVLWPDNGHRSRFQHSNPRLRGAELTEVVAL